MLLPGKYRPVFIRGVNPAPVHMKSLWPDAGVLLQASALVFIWVAQIIFWRMAGREIALRFNFYQLALPVAAYVCSSLFVASNQPVHAAFSNRLGASCRTGLVWVALSCIFIALALLKQSIFIFSLAAALFGAGLTPLMRQAALTNGEEQTSGILVLATVAGVAIGVLATGGILFVELHLPQLMIALVMCLTLAIVATQARALQAVKGGKSSMVAARNAARPSLTDSLKLTGCSVLIATPVALAPILEPLCGIGVAGLGFGLFAHYGAILLPGILWNKWQPGFLRYSCTGLYVLFVVAGHVLTLVYLAGAVWW